MDDKARKMDSECFATPLVPDRTDLVKIVRGYLLEGTDSTREIKLELCRLNVYDKGSGSGSSFFKSYVDTPPPDGKKKMFGSLVIVFPTPHEGGTLRLRHHGQEWTFDSALELAGVRTPTIGYIAFFSDVKHKVAPVTSGHRVTLTYNLHFDDNGPASATDSKLLSYHQPAANERTFRTTLEALLENGEFLPEGGTLGFGLRHVYPVVQRGSLNHVYDLLKGSDAAIYRSFRALGFDPVLYLYHEWYSPESETIEAVISEEVIDILGELDVMDVTMAIYNNGGVVVWVDGGDSMGRFPRWKNPEKVHWVTPVTEFNHWGNPYPTYGNQLEVDFVYGDLCLVVRIGKAGERLVCPTVRQIRKACQSRSRS
ncbi:hypothetical protein B0F90DRAFT_1763795 [Multifurca ochricompacta]|uniref:Fe2OG dioxygenase domain-containing protein n=1 Tax=Multifurca ochricompacta TaxID=376703 RepID=A0AAD4QIT2_9AGAM|nr:hypothetical protein B0F90DRAFT_1763795 [Multifurca ochricompacta]